MSVRNLVGALVAVGLVAVMSATPVHAKGCGKLCKVQIRTCKQACVEKPKGPCKHACKHFLDECKQSSTDPKMRICPNSPSGAFID